MQPELKNISVAGMSISLAELHRKELKGNVSIAKAVENLEALGLCECIKDMERSKRLKFNAEGLAL